MYNITIHFPNQNWQLFDLCFLVLENIVVFKVFIVKNLKSSIITGLLLQIYNLKFSKEKKKWIRFLKFQNFISLKNIKMVIFNKLIILVFAKTKFDAYNIAILKHYNYRYMWHAIGRYHYSKCPLEES